MKQDELERKIQGLEKRIKYLEDWIATHRSQPLPQGIKRCIGTVLPKDGLIIPHVEA